jgi:hypothetical protein
MDDSMNVAVKHGVALGVVVGALGFLLAALGMHMNPALPMVFVGLATIINVVVMFLALRRTASASSWVGQVRNGLALGVVGAVIVFASSWVMTALVFPDYHAEFAAAQRATLESLGVSAADVELQMVAFEQATSVGSALSGAVGTLITSAVSAAVIGFFKRQND